MNLHCGTDINYLKPKQVVTIKQALKNDCISVLPTGYGKSLIFEILPFVDFSFYDRQCLVLLICPLNVIIEQEIAKLGAKSIRASDLLYKDESKDLTPILYIVGHPEDITQPSILEEVSRLNRRTSLLWTKLTWCLSGGKNSDQCLETSAI